MAWACDGDKGDVWNGGKSKEKEEEGKKKGKGGACALAPLLTRGGGSRGTVGFIADGSLGSSRTTGVGAFSVDNVVTCSN